MQKKKILKKAAAFGVEKIFLISACIAVLALLVIGVYILVSGLPGMFRIGVGQFLFGEKWSPTEGYYGILTMIIATLIATIGAAVLGVGIGVPTAVFLAEIAPKWAVKILRPAVELLAGIPSVVYGYFGLVVLVPFISNTFGGAGNSLLAVIIILGIMILPTIINLSEMALRAVPASYKEGSLGLGASRMQTLLRVSLPSAKSGIAASIILGVGRAVGETMAVILVAGNTPQIPGSLLDSVRTLTINIAFEMSYASGIHREALFATGVVLFAIIMILNFTLQLVLNRKAGTRKRRRAGTVKR